MDRKSFLKQGILGTGVFVASSISAKLLVNDIDELKPLQPIDETLSDLITYLIQNQISWIIKYSIRQIQEAALIMVG